MTGLRTAACDLFGTQYPIVQTGMGWVAGARLTAATSAAGGLGILASATMTMEELTTAVHAVKERTDRPFGVNLRSDQADVDERIALIVREGVRVASFAQAPGERLVRTLKDQGVVVMPTIGAPRHAEKVAAWGWTRSSRRAPRVVATPAPSRPRCSSRRSPAPWTSR